jgi:hypothetical protein
MNKPLAPLLLLALAAPLAAEVTFNEHIAPLVHQNCTGCHRPEQSGPFSLITYRDVKKRSRTIEEVLLDRYMPPWKPVNTNIHFANDRRLSDEEIKLFSAWVNDGTPEGDPGKKPKPPEYPSGWYLGEPDLVVTMNGTFDIPAEGKDIYRSFVFPLQLSEDKWVKAVELRPKAKSAVHHALFFIDTDGQARKRDGSDGRAGISGMGFLRGADPSAAFNGSGGLGGHVPGATPAKLPGDLAMFLPKGSDVVMQTHFHPSGKQETEQAELALYFADKAPVNNLVAIQIPPVFGATKNINIPAGESNYVVEDSFTIPVPVKAVLVGGHAHYLCRNMKMTATLPGGKEMALLDISDWDLDWQDRYHFEKPIEFPAGTVLKTRLVYDNSAGNPENPFSPPRRVRWGRQSTDEMGSVTLTVVPKGKSQGDLIAKAQRQQLFSGASKAIEQARKTFFNVKSYDRNKDGLVQEDEVPQRMRRRIMTRFDKNQDGVLDAEEQPALQEYLNGILGGRVRPRAR